VKAGVPITQPHPLRPLNAERYLKSAREMADLFSWRPESLSNSLRIFELCESAFPQPKDVTPSYPIPGNHRDASGYLRHLVYKGAAWKYKTISASVESRIEHELAIINPLGYADYFLMAWQIVRWARRQGIRVTGRGSAADSCVAYCLMLTDVEVIQRGLPFARFITEGKTPDIDIDFPSDRRDEVFEHIQSQYGKENVGMVCTYHTYWGKGAVRDFGKVLEIPPDLLKWFSTHLSGFVSADRLNEAFEKNAELRTYTALRDRCSFLFNHCRNIAGFPRHIGTHSSGIVISRKPLNTIAPLQNSAKGLVRIWTLDKDDAEEVGAIKLDILALRMLSAVNDTEADVQRQSPDFRYDNIPMGDSATYRMIRSGKAIGTFQFESAAQCSLATMLGPEHFEDLVASVALIRPGPVRGNVVSKYVSCRNGYANADCLHPALRKPLAKTYGCIVFQEQVNDVVAIMTGCTEAEADRFRKRLLRYAKTETMDDARSEFIRKSMELHHDLAEETANFIFDMIEGWSGYGFTEGHAASFALTGYRTAYLSVHSAAAFYASQMNHMPMGYYSSNSLAAEARKRGVRILPVDINLSEDKSYAEEKTSIRLGLRLIDGLRDEEIVQILETRRDRPFVSLLDFCTRVSIRRDTIENIVLSGAFDQIHEHRRGILWCLPETLAIAGSYRKMSNTQKTLELGSVEHLATPTDWDIQEFSPWEAFSWSWRVTGVCADAHPFAYLRERLREQEIISTHEALNMKKGVRVRVAGINIRPHRPPTRSGEPVLFSTLEDETDVLQVICTGEAIAKTTAVWLTSLAVVAEGVIERRGTGKYLKVSNARSLRMLEFVEPHIRTHYAPQPPSVRTYPGTRLAGDSTQPASIS
jgi:error-prone DNA polymerase